MGKYLGQHFLINKDKLREIVETLELKSGDAVIEIGPGHGELTDELRIKNNELRIIAIEKDKKLADSLKEKFSGNKNIKIIHADVLKILPSIIHNSSFIIRGYKIVGNIPYYITGYLLRILGELENKPLLIVLTVQKEVAERICGAPPKMNLLAASVQFWAEPKIVDYISKRDFQPRPKVDSAIIKLTPKPSTLNVKPYYRLIKILFKQPRKTILNNLLNADLRGFERRLTQIDRKVDRKEKIKEKLDKLGINPNARPQDLSIQQIKKLVLIY